MCVYSALINCQMQIHRMMSEHIICACSQQAMLGWEPTNCIHWLYCIMMKILLEHAFLLPESFVILFCRKVDRYNFCKQH